MTNLQLLLVIGIPSFLALLSTINSNHRFGHLDKRMDGLDKRIDGVERRIDAVDRRLDGHDRRFDELLAAGHKDALEIMRSMTAIHERLAVVESRQAS